MKEIERKEQQELDKIEKEKKEKNEREYFQLADYFVTVGIDNYHT